MTTERETRECPQCGPVETAFKAMEEALRLLVSDYERWGEVIQDGEAEGSVPVIDKARAALALVEVSR